MLWRKRYQNLFHKYQKLDKDFCQLKIEHAAIIVPGNNIKKTISESLLQLCKKADVFKCTINGQKDQMSPRSGGIVGELIDKVSFNSI